MKISDFYVQEAIAAIDKGDVPLLGKLINKHPQLLTDRIITPQQEEEYFKDPYLLWFIAENPVRRGTLPVNILDVTQYLVQSLSRNDAQLFQEQIDYTLGLVSSGRVPREQGVQNALINLLVDAGANPDEAINAAVAHNEVVAVKQLVDRGAKLTLVVAIALNQLEHVKSLADVAHREELQAGLAIAALYGQAESIGIIIRRGVDVDAYCPKGFHMFSTPLHQAVSSGSLEAVKVLVEAGADLKKRDKIYFGIALGWAEYLKHPSIAMYLREKMASKMIHTMISSGVTIQPHHVDKAVTILARELEI